VTCLWHTDGQFLSQREYVNRLLSQTRGSRVEVRNLTQLADERNDARAGFFRLTHHFALAARERVIGVPLKHAQVPADDPGGCPELVNGQREQLRIIVFVSRHNVHALVDPCGRQDGLMGTRTSSLTQRSRRQFSQFSKFIRLCACPEPPTTAQSGKF